MVKNLRERIELSFSEDDHESVGQYIDWLRATLFDLSANVRRTGILLVFLMAIFEFVEFSGSATILGGFHVSKGSVVLQFIPALVSYLYLRIIQDTVKGNALVKVFNVAFDRWYPKAKDYDLGALILPISPLFWGIGGGSRVKNRYPSDTVESSAATVFMLSILLGTIAFEAQASYALFNVHTVNLRILWAISLSITLFCLSMAVSYPTVDNGMPWSSDDF